MHQPDSHAISASTGFVRSVTLTRMSSAAPAEIPTPPSARAGAPSQVPVLLAEDLTVRYGARQALSGVSFRYDGGAMGLLGPNGAGKSSFLRVVLGLIRPARGRISVLGIDPTRNSLRVRALSGYMPENECHVPGLSGVEFVTFAARMCGLSRRDSRRRAHEVLVYAGMEEERYRPVDDYSRGMKQKVKLAAALVHDPAVLFLDEPTNGLDPQARHDVLALVRDMATNKGMNVVLSSHLLLDVEAVCESVVVLDQGRVVAAGPIAGLKQAVAGFVVQIDGDPQDYVRRLTSAGYVVKADAAGRLRVVAEGDVELSVRDLYRFARESGGCLSHVAPIEESLEDLFLRAVS